jgi:hypothetical protein
MRGQIELKKILTGISASVNCMDIERYGEYRTKRVTLEIYNAMAEAMRTDRPYETILLPPPSDPSVTHPPRDD